MGMTNEEKAKYLGKTKIFEGLSGMELSRVSEYARELHFGKHSQIFKEGDPADTLYIILSGQVRVGKGDPDQESLVIVLKPGDAFGELALFDQQPRSATVTAMEEVQALSLSRDDFIALVRKMPDLALTMLQLLAGRLRSTTNVYTLSSV